jgi:predicted nucleotidyltransferase
MISLRSKITQVVLAHLFLNGQEAYASALAKRLHLDRGNLVRKLHELEREGLLTSERRGHERYYKLNTAFPLLQEYKTIIQRTVGLERQLQQVLQAVKGIEQAYIFGSYATDQMDAASDIDLLVVGDHTTTALQRHIAELQKATDREINVVSIGAAEFSRKRRNDALLKSIFKKPRRKII